MVPLSVPSDLSDRSDLSDKKLVDLLTCRLVDFYRISSEAFAQSEVDYATAMAYMRGEAIVLPDAPRGYVASVHHNAFRGAHLLLLSHHGTSDKRHMSIKGTCFSLLSKLGRSSKYSRKVLLHIVSSVSRT